MKLNQTLRIKRLTRRLLAIALLVSPFATHGQQIGDPGWELDNSRYDSRIPAMIEWAKSGVEGGIPYRSSNPIVQTLSVVSGDPDMANNIQAAINSANNSGGGVVLLQNGTYPIKSKITMKSNVILRGQSRSGTILQSTMTYQGANSADRTETILISGTRIGLEDFTLTYKVTRNGATIHPLDEDWGFTTWFPYSQRSQNYENERIYYDRPNFQYETRNNMDVTFVRMTGSATKNIWIDNCSFLESGSDHIYIQAGEHITVRNTLIDGAFQKGGNGNGYGINCNGRYVLMTDVTSRKVRHWAIQQGAEYCVVYQCDSEVDMNFHQGDLGRNLIEKTRIHIPYWGSWNCFQTGADYHGPPGEANMFFDNDCVQKQAGVLYADNKIYSFDSNRNIVALSLNTPAHGTLYAVKRSSGGGGCNLPATKPNFSISDEEKTWNSGPIDVSCVSNAKVSVRIEGVGNMETADYLNVFYKINGGPEIDISRNTDSFAAKTVSTGGINANTIHVVVRGKTSHFSEVYNISNISVTDDGGSGGSITNLSQGQPVTASGAQTQNPASNAVDGDTSTRWSIETFPQWLEVDLGSVKSISKTELVSFQDRAYQYVVEAKTSSGGSYTQVVNRSSNTTPGTISSPVTDTFAATNARYVRITVSGASGYTGSWCSQMEFRVFGQ